MKMRINNKRVPARKNPDDLTVIKLWVRAGGRCEFRGCNEYLLVDNLTLEEANFSNIAHIVAAELNGPRGGFDLPFEKRSEIENLMLLCRRHHTLIDNKKLEEKYPVELLREHKKLHEDRILRLTDVQEGSKTFVVRLKGRIDGEAVSIPNTHIKNAILPKYMADDLGMEIDLTSLPLGDDDSYWQTGQKIIDEKIKDIYRPGVDKKEIEHISVFALGPIPLLMFLGNKLSNAVEADLFHLHKDIENWTWKIDGDAIKYKIRLLSKGKKDSLVSLLLSLSGPIKMEDLPNKLKDYWVYEITLDKGTPNRMFMRMKEDLLNFRKTFRQFLCEVREKHKGVKEILVFPAVPTPVAVACGRDLIKKTDPALKIYDFNKNRGGFREVLTIN
jgi:hypothetical protein